jgi:hypothetical protein
MSSAPASPQTVLGPTADVNREIRVYSHSTLFYWWPVWAAGFIMGIISLIDGGRIAIVPSTTRVATALEGKARIEGDPEIKDLTNRKVLLAPATANEKDLPLEDPHIHMARSKNLGVLFATVLLLIVVITNVPLRGLWSLVLILFVFLLSVIFALADIWDRILSQLQQLQIFINAGGYFFIAGILFLIWAFTVLVFDHRTYVAFTSGQVRVAMAVGAGDTVFSTDGITFQKKQDDLFRHWIVGLGSGDLIIHRGTTNQEVDMPNVLFVGSKIREIERLIKEKEVV